MYENYTIYRASDRQPVGSVAAQSHAQAVFRLAGGTFGRTDFYAMSDAEIRATVPSADWAMTLATRDKARR